MPQLKNNLAQYEALTTYFRQKKFDSIYFFYGEEDFLINQAIEVLINEALDESVRSFNLDIIYGSETEAQKIISLAYAYPLIAQRRLIIVREFDHILRKEPFLQYFKNPSSTTSLVLVGNSKPDFRQKIYSRLKETATVYQFNRFTEDEILTWIQKTVSKFGRKIFPEACQILQELVGKSLRDIDNEINKLLVYSSNKELIGVDEVQNVVGISRQYNIFELQNAISNRDLKQSIFIVHKMLQMGESPIGIVAMLTKFFQKVWVIEEMIRKRVPENEYSEFLGKQRYYEKAFKEAAQRFNSEQLENCFSALLDADDKLKSSYGSDKMIMTLLIHRLLKQDSRGL